MKVITPGHKYVLDNFEDNSEGTEKNVIQFIQKEPVSDHPLADATLHTVQDGTTNEEVLNMLIDRLQFLQAKLPSRQTAIAITKLEEALMWLHNRTLERKMRGVEGTHKA